MTARYIVNVSLTPELEELVRQRVASGRYASSSEVIREALRLLAQRDQEYEDKLAALRAAIDEGWNAPLSVFDENKLRETSVRGRKRLAELRARKR